MSTKRPDLPRASGNLSRGAADVPPATGELRDTVRLEIGVGRAYVLLFALLAASLFAAYARLSSQGRLSTVRNEIAQDRWPYALDEISGGRLADKWRDVGQSVWRDVLSLVLTESAVSQLDAIAGKARKPTKERDAQRSSDAVPGTEEERPEARDPHLENVERLDGFFEKLARLERGEKGLSRVLFFGTSEIGKDEVTSQLRRNLQERFGDGGKGFTLVTRTWGLLDHRDVIWEFDSNDWESQSIRGGALSHGNYGLGGVVHYNKRPTKVRWATVGPGYGIEEGFKPFPTGTRWSRAEVRYQKFPGGGSFDLTLDGNKLATINSDAEKIEDGVFVVDAKDGAHELVLQTSADTSRVYGALFERERGIVLDALMVIGGWGDDLTEFSQAHLNRQVGSRNPDLLVFQYGAKEILRSPEQSPEQIATFTDAFRRGIEMVRVAQPFASCLVIAPKDQAFMVAGRLETPSGLPKIVEATRDAARQAGCAFYDLFEAMGGKRSIVRWFHNEPPLVIVDHKHLTTEGAIRVGDMLSDLILDEYESFHSWKTREGTKNAGLLDLDFNLEDAEAQAVFRAPLAGDKLDPVEPCDEAELVAIDCRDPTTYLSTMQRGTPIWEKVIAGLGGTYLGVGADQNYSLIAKARSEWAWLASDDAVVSRLHRAILALVAEHETPRAFAEAFEEEQLDAGKVLVRDYVAGLELSPAEVEVTVQTYVELSPVLRVLFRRALRKRPLFPDWGWLHNSEDYAYIRALTRAGRIRVVNATLDGKAFGQIAERTRALGHVIRVAYLSNHENFWSSYPDSVRQNLIALPFDERSVVLRVLAGKRWNQKSGFSRWHYNAHVGADFQVRILNSKIGRPRDMMEGRKALTEFSSILGADAALSFEAFDLEVKR